MPGIKLRVQKEVDIYSTQETINQVKESITYLRTDDWKPLEQGKESTIEGIKIKPIDGTLPPFKLGGLV